MSVVVRVTSLDVLLALVGSAVDGSTVQSRLEGLGKPSAAAPLLTHLLRLESSGHVRVRRGDGYMFSLTPLGREAVSDLAPGQVVERSLVMIDLVGFVPFTAAQGDEAARDAAQRLHSVSDTALRRVGGRTVKGIGDGVLGCAPLDVEMLPVLRRVAGVVAQPESGGWQVRASAHTGTPIEIRGDLFGHDVNLVARLCALAAPGEAVCSAPGASGAELVEVKGLTDPVPIVRCSL